MHYRLALPLIIAYFAGLVLLSGSRSDAAPVASEENRRSTGRESSSRGASNEEKAFPWRAVPVILTPTTNNRWAFFPLFRYVRQMTNYCVLYCTANDLRSTYDIYTVDLYISPLFLYFGFMRSETAVYRSNMLWPSWHGGGPNFSEGTLPHLRRTSTQYATAVKSPILTTKASGLLLCRGWA